MREPASRLDHRLADNQTKTDRHKRFSFGRQQTWAACWSDHSGFKGLAGNPYCNRGRYFASHRKAGNVLAAGLAIADDQLSVENGDFARRAGNRAGRRKPRHDRLRMERRRCAAALVKIPRHRRFGPLRRQKLASQKRGCRLVVCSGNWLRGWDLNPRLQGYEPCELPGCSTPQAKIKVGVSPFKD
jgi:hypothetical protein